MADQNYALWTSDRLELKVKGDGRMWEFHDGRMELRDSDAAEFDALVKKNPIVLSLCKKLDMDSAEALVRRHMAQRRNAAVAGTMHSGIREHAEGQMAQRDEELRRMGVDPEKMRGEGFNITEAANLPPATPNPPAPTGPQTTGASQSPGPTPQQPGNVGGTDFTGDFEKAKEQQAGAAPKGVGVLFPQAKPPGQK